VIIVGQRSKYYMREIKRTQRTVLLILSDSRAGHDVLFADHNLHTSGFTITGKQDLSVYETYTCLLRSTSREVSCCPNDGQGASKRGNILS
jgi:hypothetical protein